MGSGTKNRASYDAVSKERPVPIGVAAALGVGVIVIFLVFAGADLSGTEAVLLGVVQTIFSLFVGWLITHKYAQDAKRSAVREIEDIHQRNLRTYALKAAEKVENLSRELNRMALYLGQELEESEYATVEEALSAKEERMQSAIHILNTLKSVNDTSLSDWRGVIGDEIEEIRIRAEQREETLEKLVDRIQALESEGAIGAGGDGVAVPVLREIDKLRRDLKFLASDVAGSVWTARKPIPGARRNFQAKCPECDAPVTFRQKDKEGSRKGVNCKVCNSRLVSEIQLEGSPVLRKRISIEDRIHCEGCAAEGVVSIDELIGASTRFICSNCGKENRATRAKDGVVVSLVLKNHPITEGLIEAVREALPQQPWGKGIHEQVAQQLGLSPQTVQKAISQLILRGVFMDQFQGVICTTAEKLDLMRKMGRDL